MHEVRWNDKLNVLQRPADWVEVTLDELQVAANVADTNVELKQQELDEAMLEATNAHARLDQANSVTPQWVKDAAATDDANAPTDAAEVPAEAPADPALATDQVAAENEAGPADGAEDATEAPAEPELPAAQVDTTATLPANVAPVDPSTLPVAPADGTTNIPVNLGTIAPL